MAEAEIFRKSRRFGRKIRFANMSPKIVSFSAQKQSANRKYGEFFARIWWGSTSHDPTRGY
jgi:hypothetical protein